MNKISAIFFLITNLKALDILPENNNFILEFIEFSTEEN